ncbi:hypothetical protein SDC9_151053 [bioreactor metagenome]|uniref:Uncharacterized protein n=1 Tax=bioreactor metagenome TaxID=1076179 RepID=A0A645ERL2_9ZZZZ
MKQAGGTIMNADSGFIKTSGEFGRPSWSFTPHKVDTSNANATGLALVHADRANVSFMDGHAKNDSAGELRSSPTNARQFVTAAGEAYPATQWDSNYN